MSKTQGSPRGLLFGFLGVLAFSLTVPLTRVAVAQLDPAFVGLGRALAAAALAAALLLLTRQGLPERQHWGRLMVVGSGVIVGLLPAATAVMAVLRAGERLSRAFWGACASGLFAVLLFAASRGAGLVPDRGTCLYCSPWCCAPWGTLRAVPWPRRSAAGA